MFTEEAVGSLVGALRSLPPRDAAEESETSGGPARPDVRKREGCTRVGWCQIWRKRSPKPTQRAGLANLAAPEICVKRRASDAHFGEQPSQHK